MVCSCCTVCSVVCPCQLFCRHIDVCYCVCVGVVNKQFELLEFVFDSVYDDLQYDEISLTFTAGSVFLCCVCSMWSF